LGFGEQEVRGGGGIGKCDGVALPSSPPPLPLAPSLVLVNPLELDEGGRERGEFVSRIFDIEIRKK